MAGLDENTSESYAHLPPTSQSTDVSLPPCYLQQNLLALLELSAFEQGSSQVKQNLCVLILVKFLQAVLILKSRV